VGRFLITLLAVGLFAVAGCSNDAGPAIAIDPAVMYAQNCAKCHGADGHGNAEIKKTMPTVRDFSDPMFISSAQPDTVVRTIMAGKGQMPAFGASLSLPKMQSLSGYVLRLGRGQVH
jgi:cytochrome c oxidase cbb3-type subunit III